MSVESGMRLIMMNGRVNPPLPSSSSSSSSADSGDLNGQRLLSLVKTALQKKKQQQQQTDDVDGVVQNDEDFATTTPAAVQAAASNNKAVDESIEILEHVIAQTCRRGLLQGNVALAEKVLAATSSRNNNQNNNNNNNNNNSGSGKRKREKGGRNNNNTSSSFSSGLVIYANDFKGDSTANTNTTATTTTSSSTTTLDVNLIISAILRILTSSSNNKKQDLCTNISTFDVNLLVIMVADLCTAISEYIKMLQSQSNNNLVVLAEYELLAASAKAILTGLSNYMQGIIILISSQQEDTEENELVLRSCLRASASLIGLFGTKLARSVAILQLLGKVAWQVVLLLTSSSGNDSDENSVIDAATILLSTLPCAGGLDRITPSQLWNASFVNTMQLLTLLLQAVVPVSQRLGKMIQNNATITGSHLTMMDDTFKNVLDSMLQNITSVKDEDSRVTLFLDYTHALCRLMCHYLQQQQHQQLSLRQIHVSTFLDLIDVLLSFPMVAEAVYYGTKKRLRMEIVDGGLLNIKSIATIVANPFKLIGFQLLHVLVNVMGGPLLLPFASRLTRTAHAALLTSSSNMVRSVLDPAGGAATATVAANNNNKRQRWLNTSIVVRTAGLKSLTNIVQTFGAIDESKNNNNNNNNSQQHRMITSETDRSIALVAACLVEQIQLTNGTNGNVQHQQHQEWGSLNERVELVIQATKCLQAYLLSYSGGGAFLSMEARTLIESVTESCLTKLISSSSPCPVLGFTTVQATLLSLGTSCVCTAWPDGGASALQGILCNAAKTCQYRSSNEGSDYNDNDNELIQAASTALRLCESLANPRVPAIQIVTRQQQSMPFSVASGGGGGSSRIATHASDLANRLEQAHNESMRLAEQEKARNRQKEANKSNKKAKEATTTSKMTPPPPPPETEVNQPTITSTNSGTTIMDKKGNESVSSTKVDIHQSESSLPKEEEEEENKTNLLSSSANNTKQSSASGQADKKEDYNNKNDNNHVGGKEENDEDDDDFPMIMAVGPDEDDK